MSEAREEDLSALFPNERTARARQHRHYALRALHVLGGTREPAFAWLCPDEETIVRREGGLLWTILAELGRVRDEDELREMALDVCDLKPRSRKGVALVRAWRLGRVPRATVDALMWSLVTFVNRYLDSHPGMSEATACRALVEASWVFSPDPGEDDQAPPKKARGKKRGGA
jgi:hypothetical protein